QSRRGAVQCRRHVARCRRHVDQWEFAILNLPNQKRNRNADGALVNLLILPVPFALRHARDSVPVGIFDQHDAAELGRHRACAIDAAPFELEDAAVELGGEGGALLGVVADLEGDAAAGFVEEHEGGADLVAMQEGGADAVGGGDLDAAAVFIGGDGDAALGVGMVDGDEALVVAAVEADARFEAGGEYLDGAAGGEGIQADDFGAFDVAHGDGAAGLGAVKGDAAAVFLGDVGLLPAAELEQVHDAGAEHGADLVGLLVNEDGAAAHGVRGEGDPGVAGGLVHGDEAAEGVGGHARD